MLPSRTPSAVAPLRRLGALLAAALPLLGACADTDDSTSPRGEAEVTVMTRNIYLGANIFRIAEAQSFQQVPVVIGQMFATVQQTNFPERAKALAAEIAAHRPALVGLQEVSLYRTQTPGDFLSNPFANAPTVAYDFVQSLLVELQARGLSYRVAASVQNSDAEMPALLNPATPTALSDVRFTEFGVILARSDVQTSAPLAQNYGISQRFGVGGLSVAFQRGYTKVDAEVDGARFTFVNTHVEGNRPAHDAQALEFVRVVNSFRGPLLVTGDFNSQPDGSTTPGYGIVTGQAGLKDAWATLYPSQPGFTCCFGERVNDANNAALDERIDYVFFRGHGVRPVSAEVVGDEPVDRTPSGLWPSDHAGVVATFRIPRS